MAFLAALREGFETAVFLWPVHASGDRHTSWLGAVLGIVLAAGIATHLQGRVKLNLAVLRSPACLVVVAAGW